MSMSYLRLLLVLLYKWKPKRIAIEDSVGVKWMGRELRREMDSLQISIPVEFCSLGLGSKTANSKKLKAKPVLRLLGDETCSSPTLVKDYKKSTQRWNSSQGTSE